MRKLAIATIFAVFCITGCKDYTIRLNDHYCLTAYRHNPYQTILVDSHGNVIISDSISTFWGKYPYLWGQAYNKKKKSYYFFLFNLDTGELSTQKVWDIMKKKGLPDFGGYEQISLWEFFSSDSSVDQGRNKLFIRQMQLKNR